MKVAPKSVSGRVVNTSIISPPAVTERGSAGLGSASPASMTGNRRVAPSLRPIQFCWALRVLSDQSMCSRLSSRRWA